MTKKDYVKIAETINKAHHEIIEYPMTQNYNTLQTVRFHLCRVFEQDNPKFNIERIAEACFGAKTSKHSLRRMK